MMQATERFFVPMYDSIIAVSLGMETADELVASNSSENDLALIQAATTTYFNTNLYVHGAVLWKSCTPVLDDGHMFVFKDEEGYGWYCSNTVWGTAEQFASLYDTPQLRIAFWIASTPDDVVGPEGGLHHPWWASDALIGWDVKSGYDRLSEAEAELTIMRQSQAQADGQPAASSTGSGAASAPEQRDQHKEMPKGVGGHGGWMPRAASLIKAYERGDWDECTRLINEYRSTSDRLCKLLGR